MILELERTFLVRELPRDLEKHLAVEVVDLYIPQAAPHPTLRLRKRGETFEMTKKFPQPGRDASELGEQTIPLSKEEFDVLSVLPGKRLRKIRYNYLYNGRTAEIGVFLEELQGLVLADFEFAAAQEKEKFAMPGFCLADVTQEEFFAGGFLAGKKYSDLEPFLAKHGYQKIIGKNLNLNAKP